MNKNFSIILTFAIFALVLFSCQDYDEVVSDPKTFWSYEGTNTNVLRVIGDLKRSSEIAKSTGGVDLRNEIKGQPLWDKGKVLVLNDVPTFLVPVKSNKWNFIRAVLAINYRTGGGNLQYTVIYRKDLNKPTKILPREAWGGYISALDKELLKVKNNSPGFQRTKIQNSARLKDYVCSVYLVEDCWHWGYIDNEAFVEGGVSCQYSIEEECDWIGDSGSGEVGSCSTVTACAYECGTYDPCYCEGNCGGDGGPDAPPETSTADHSLPNKSKLPPAGTTDTQLGTMCVFKTMEWVAKYFDKSITSGTSLLYYCQTNNLKIEDVMLKDGVTLDDLAPLISHYFDMSSTTDIQGSINSGNPVMATFVNGTNGHEVMITGYNNDGKIEYFDPETGNYATTSSENLQNLYKITGVK